MGCKRQRTLEGKGMIAGVCVERLGSNGGFSDRLFLVDGEYHE